jgi:hypothetical protein
LTLANLTESATLTTLAAVWILLMCRYVMAKHLFRHVLHEIRATEPPPAGPPLGAGPPLNQMPSDLLVPGTLAHYLWEHAKHWGYCMHLLHEYFECAAGPQPCMHAHATPPLPSASQSAGSTWRTVCAASHGVACLPACLPACMPQLQLPEKSRFAAGHGLQRLQPVWICAQPTHCMGFTVALWVISANRATFCNADPLRCPQDLTAAARTEFALHGMAQDGVGLCVCGGGSGSGGQTLHRTESAQKLEDLIEDTQVRACIPLPVADASCLLLNICSVSAQ